MYVAHNIFEFFYMCKRSRNHIVNMHYSKNVSTEKSKPRQTLDPCSVSIFRSLVFSLHIFPASCYVLRVLIYRVATGFSF